MPLAKQRCSHVEGAYQPSAPSERVVLHFRLGCRDAPTVKNAVNTPAPSTQHARLAKRRGIRLSLRQRGQCWDNAVAESFFATIKTELLNRQPWPTRATARQAIFEYVEGWYNTRRRHSSLGYLSPAAYEASAVINPLPASKVT